MGYYEYKKFCQACTACGATTSKAYARLHEGLCKACLASDRTGQSIGQNKSLLCPDCGVNYLTPYQKKHNYHCNACTREADPEGYRREMNGLDQHEADSNY
jgi:hypothetical protein